MSGQLETVAEAERKVLAAMILTPDKAVDVGAILRPEHFQDKRGRHIAEAIFVLAAKPDPWDLLALKSQLRAVGKYDEVGALTLVEFAGATNTSVYAMQHAAIVRNAATLRSLSDAGGVIGRSSREANPNDQAAVDDVLERAEAAVYAASHQATEDMQLQTIDAVAASVLESLDKGEGGWTTGYYDLDSMLVDVRPTEFHGIAARPGCGKTAFALNLLLRFAKQGARCLFISLEMGLGQLGARILATEAEVDASRMRSRTLGAEDRSALQVASEEIQGLPIRLFEDSGSTVGRIAAQARRVSRELKGLDFIFVDYAQLMTDPTKQNRYEAMTAISNGLKGLARSMHLTVFSLLQLNRESADKKPEMHHLRDTGAFEQDLDGCILLHPKPDDAGGDTDEVEAILAKWRHGQTGKASLYFRKRYGRFDNPTLGEMETIP